MPDALEARRLDQSWGLALRPGTKTHFWAAGAVLIGGIAVLELIDRFLPDVSATALGDGFLVVAALASGILFVTWLRTQTFDSGARRDRIAARADAVGYDYLARATALPPLPELLGTSGDRFCSDLVVRRDGRALEFGNYQWGFDKTVVTGRSKLASTVNDFGFLRAQLDRPVPQIQLRSTRHRGRGFWDAPPLDSQRLSLEGDFDQHFELFCPAGYERDALYIFTPDLMALMVDRAHGFDAQLADDVLLVTSSRPLDLDDERQFVRMLEIADIVTAKALRQTRVYTDPRSRVPGRVALVGRRLAPGILRPALFVGILIGWPLIVVGAVALLRALF